MKVPEPKKLPSGNYRIQMMLGGERFSVTRSSKAECIHYAELAKAEYRAENKRVNPCKKTLAKAEDDYIASRTNTLSASTIAGYRKIQTVYFKDVASCEIGKVNWQAEVNKLAAIRSPKTVKNAWAFVNSVLKENGVNVSVSLPKMEVKEHPFLSPAEVQKFIGLLDGEAVAIPAMLGLLSLRKSEIIALDWKDVDLDRKTIYVHSADVTDEHGRIVHKKTTKNRTSTRTVPIIIPSLFSALCAVEDKTGKVCTMYHATIYKAVNRICERNGLPKIGVHGLRHSAVSLLYALGVSEAASMRICGYSDWGTMRKIYTHLDSSAIDDVRAKAESFFTRNCTQT